MEGFTKLSEVEVISEVNDEATVIIESGGEIKRFPKSEFAGKNNIATFFKVYGDNYVYKTDSYESDLVPSDDKKITMSEFKEAFLNSECFLGSIRSDSLEMIYKVTGFIPYGGNSETVANICYGNKTTNVNFIE